MITRDRTLLLVLLCFTSRTLAGQRATRAPDTPGNVRIIKCDGRRAMVGWDRARPGDVIVRLYRIQYSTNLQPGLWHDAQTIGAKAQKVNIKMPANAEVKVRVHAYNARGMSPPGEAKQKCVVPEARPDRNPVDVTGKGTTPNNMVISWTPMSIIDHNGPDFHYVVKWRQRGKRRWQKFRVSHPVSSFTVDELRPYTAHDVIVMAANAIGPAVIVPRKVIGYSGENIPEVFPANFRLVGYGELKEVDAGRTVSFEWKTVNASDSAVRGEFRGYRIFLIDRLNPRRTWQTDILVPKRKRDPSPQVTVVGTVSDLIPATQYQAYVTVINNRYIGPPSRRVDFSTRETAPGPVGNLHVVRADSSSAIVAWYPPKAPNGRILGYTYSYTKLIGEALGRGVDGDDMLSSMTNHVQLRHLAANTTYRVYVFAHTAAGRGPGSSVDVTIKEPIRPKKSSSSPVSKQSVHPTLSMEYLAKEGSQYLEAVKDSAHTHRQSSPVLVALLIFYSVIR